MGLYEKLQKMRAAKAAAIVRAKQEKQKVIEDKAEASREIARKIAAQNRAKEAEKELKRLEKERAKEEAAPSVAGWGFTIKRQPIPIPDRPFFGCRQASVMAVHYVGGGSMSFEYLRFNAESLAWLKAQSVESVDLFVIPRHGAPVRFSRKISELDQALLDIVKSRKVA